MSFVSMYMYKYLGNISSKDRYGPHDWNDSVFVSIYDDIPPGPRFICSSAVDFNIA